MNIKSNKNRIFILKISALLISFALLKISCAASSDLDNGAPGVCPLNCGSSSLPSNDMRIRFLLPEGITQATPFTLNCFDIANADYVNDVPIRFVVEKPRYPLPASEPGTEVIGGQIPRTNVDSPDWVPVSGVAFQPLLLAGIMDPLNQENQQLDRYKGIVTPETEWCTDACGVGSLDIKPRCLSGAVNNISVGIISGSLYGQFNVSVSQP